MPAMTESARTDPPGTTRQRSAPSGSDRVNRSTASGGTTSAIRVSPGAARRMSRLHRQVGRPHRSAQSLSLPILVLRPAATRMAAVRGHAVVVVAHSASPRGWAKIMRPATVWRTRVTLTGSSWFMKPLPALDHDHRPVVEVSDALAGLLALLDDAHAHLLTGMDDRLHGVRQLVDVQDADPLQLRDAVEVVVVGEDGGLVVAGIGHELGVDLGDLRVDGLADLDRRGGVLLERGEHLEAAASAACA